MKPPFANWSDDADSPRGPGGGRGRRGGPFGGPGGPRGFGGPRGRGPRTAADVPDASDAAGWFAGRLPEGWFVSAPEVIVDRDEITVIGELAAVDGTFEDAAAQAAAETGRISRFREETREARIDIARQAEHRYGRAVAWGARIGETGEVFTSLSVPVMTRLRQADRQVLDTLIDAGVARSRSEALVWAIRLVGEHADTWLAELREAMEQVNKLRAQGPDLT